jgi:SAM-dependent methyltransferase
MSDIVNVDQAAAWDGPSGARWVAREEFQNAALAGPTEHLLAAATIQPTDHVLDVGCGTGATTRRAARAAADGDALGVDLSTAMLARARERATAEGIANVTFERADAQVHPFGAGMFDRVISRFGVMFFADPVAAFANLARATRAGGRLAVVVWQGFARNEWVRLPHQVLSVGRDVPPPPDDVPGAFGLADPDRLRHILAEAGWNDLETDDVAVAYRYGADPATAAQHASDIGVLRELYQGLDDEQQARAMGALTEAMAAHATGDGVHLDARIWVVKAVR